MRYEDYLVQTSRPTRIYAIVRGTCAHLLEPGQSDASLYNRILVYRVQVQTLLQGVQLTEENEHLPVAIARQKSAFPPNFVHSLDSTHMLLTAIEMDKAQVPFAAVHDSYWVHAGNIDDMNAKLRQASETRIAVRVLLVLLQYQFRLYLFRGLTDML